MTINKLTTDMQSLMLSVYNNLDYTSKLKVYKLAPLDREAALQELVINKIQQVGSFKHLGLVFNIIEA